MVSDVMLWMLEIALIGGAAMLLRHRTTADRDRQAPDSATGTVTDPVAPPCRVPRRQALVSILRAAGAMIDAAGPVPFDRARAELLEPPARRHPAISREQRPG